MSGIRYNDRALILGDTGAGKSELINFLWEGFSCQRLLLDSKDEFSVPDLRADAPAPGPLDADQEGPPMLAPISDVGDIDWRAPVIHYVPATEDVAEMDELFAAAYERRGALLVAAHELSDVCAYHASRTPAGFDRYVSKGRSRGKGLLGGSQLPVHMPVRAKSLNQHVLVAVPRFLRADDMKAVAQAVGRDWQEFAGQLDTLQAELGDHAYVWFDRRERTLVACPPLSEQARARITIVRRDDA